MSIKSLSQLRNLLESRETHNSLDRPIASHPDHLENFHKWFGDSKARDEKGRPLVAFHGSPEDFSKFATDKGTTEGAAFFTVHPQTATQFATGAIESSGGRGDADEVTYPVYLKVKNPMVLDSKDVMKRYARVDGKVVDDPKGEHSDHFYSHSFDAMRAAVKKAKQLGHDGLHIKNVPETDDFPPADQWAVFKPHQIKSATGNKGNYNPKKHDITESLDDFLNNGNFDSKSKNITESHEAEDLPPAPGTAPVKEGHVRLYHQTDAENLESIKKHGISIDHAKGIEGPRAVYAGETPFYGAAEKIPTVEFQVEKEHWHPPFVTRDVKPEDFLAVHEPWHQQARYIANNPKTLENTLKGEFDDLGGHYAPAVAWAKKKFGGLNESQTRPIAPGVTGYIESGDWGTSIYEWNGDHTGRTRDALRSLKRPIHVMDPGQPGTDSHKYWTKMYKEGLVDHIHDADDNDITHTMTEDVEHNENFKQWFGDSVTHNDGKPMVLYHGTHKDVEAFNTPMIWGSSNPQHASDYAEAGAEYRGGNANVIPVHMKISRPFDANQIVHLSNDPDRVKLKPGEQYSTIGDLIHEAARQAREHGHDISDEHVADIKKNVQDHWNRIGMDNSLTDTHHHWSMVGKEGTIKLRHMLGSMGFDGIKYHEEDWPHGGYHVTYGAFHPSQVKSAVGNKGSFDPSNHKITESKEDFLKHSVVKHVVYHGTGADFDQFKRRPGDVGIHLGTIDQANDRLGYVQDRKTKSMDSYHPNVMPVHVNITNPLRMRDSGSWNPFCMNSELAKLFPQHIDTILGPERTSSFGHKFRSGGLKTNKEVREFIQNRGHDGIVYKNTGETGGSEPYRKASDETRDALMASQKARGKSLNCFDLEDQKTPEYMAHEAARKAYDKHREDNAEDSYIAFEPHQIKSAIGNNGNYNQRSKKITEAFKRNSRNKTISPSYGDGENLSLFKPTQSETHLKNFNDWFSGSKAVHEKSGRPLVMYHTTKNDFHEFETGRTTKNSGTFGDWETQRHAIFVTPHRDASEAYGKYGDDFKHGANVMPVYVSAKNPLDLRYESNGMSWDKQEAFAKHGIHHHYTRDFGWHSFDDEDGKRFVEAAKAMGHDAVIFNEEDPDTGKRFESWALFHPHQVKSAIGNNGNYDPSNHKITESVQKNVEWMTPNFDHEWEHEGKNYPNLWGSKEEFVAHMNTGSMVPLKKTSDVWNHMTDKSEWSQMDPDKRARAESAFAAGKVELPIVLNHKREGLYLLGGNTRLNYSNHNGHNTHVWMVNTKKNPFGKQVNEESENMTKKLTLTMVENKQKASELLETIKELDIFDGFQKILESGLDGVLESYYDDKLGSSNPMDRFWIAHTGTDAHRDQLIKDEDAMVRFGVAQKGHMTHLAQLVTDPHPKVRDMVARRGDEDIVSKLAEDPHLMVRNSALARMRELEQIKKNSDAAIISAENDPVTEHFEAGSDVKLSDGKFAKVESFFETKNDGYMYVVALPDGNQKVLKESEVYSLEEGLFGDEHTKNAKATIKEIGKPYPSTDEIDGEKLRKIDDTRSKIPLGHKAHKILDKAEHDIYYHSGIRAFGRAIGRKLGHKLDKLFNEDRENEFHANLSLAGDHSASKPNKPVKLKRADGTIHSEHENESQAMSAFKNEPNNKGMKIVHEGVLDLFMKPKLGNVFKSHLDNVYKALEAGDIEAAKSHLRNAEMASQGATYLSPEAAKHLDSAGIPYMHEEFYDDSEDGETPFFLTDKFKNECPFCDEMGLADPSEHEAAMRYHEEQMKLLQTAHEKHMHSKFFKKHRDAKEALTQDDADNDSDEKESQV